MEHNDLDLICNEKFLSDAISKAVAKAIATGKNADDIFVQNPPPGFKIEIPESLKQDLESIKQAPRIM
jgi:hypothetical protein